VDEAQGPRNGNGGGFGQPYSTNVYRAFEAGGKTLRERPHPSKNGSGELNWLSTFRMELEVGTKCRERTFRATVGGGLKATGGKIPDLGRGPPQREGRRHTCKTVAARHSLARGRLSFAVNSTRGGKKQPTSEGGKNGPTPGGVTPHCESTGQLEPLLLLDCAEVKNESSFGFKCDGVQIRSQGPWSLRRGNVSSQSERSTTTA